MARRFKFIGKKRGDRATGSRREGRLGEAIFYLAFLILGALALLLLIQRMIVPEWRVNRSYLATQGKVLATRIDSIEDGLVADPGQEEPGEGPQELRFRPQIKVEYEVGGHPHVQWTYDHLQTAFADRDDARAVIDRFEIGRSYACWYDPDTPANVVLVRGFNWWVWLILLLPTTFMLVGFGGLGYTLFYSRTSRERRAALVKQVAGSELFDGSNGSSSEFPAVPADANLKNSPGTTLPYRLPIESTPGWKLAGVVMACLFWNAIVSVLVIMSVRNHLAGDPEWFQTVFTLPFLGIGIWLIYVTIRQILFATGVGPTLIEIGDHPLRPGGEYDILLSQGGNLSIRRLEVDLICQEKATYRQGTDTVTDTVLVYRQAIFSQEKIDIQSGMPFEARCKFQVPAEAMHSFLAVNNGILWKLSIQVELARWPDFNRNFQLVVCPRNSEGKSG